MAQTNSVTCQCNGLLHQESPMMMFPIMEAVRAGGDLANIGGEYKYSMNIVCPDGFVQFLMTVKKHGNDNFYKGRYSDTDMS